MFNDNPKKDPDDDILGYKSFSSNLATILLGLAKNKQSYVIGLNGKWGDGKTTAISFAFSYLNKLLKTNNEKSIKIDNGVPLFLQFFKFIASEALIVCIATISILSIFQKVIVPLCNFSLLSLLHSPHNQLILFLIVIFSLITIFADPINAFINLFTPYWVSNLFNKKDKEYSEFDLIEFSPWEYSNEQEILKAFCLKLSSGFFIKEQNKKLIYNYINEFTKIDLSKIDSIINKIPSEQVKDELDEYFKTKSKNTIVLIDDIDRLVNADEILMVFKIVKLLANFPNVTYLLCYDKSQLEKILDDKIIEKPSEYIKKIIHTEQALPRIDEIKIKNYFFDNLKTKIFKKNVDISLENVKTNYDVLLKSYLNNLRDANKLLNNFEIKYSALKDAYIDFEKLLILCAAETFDTALFNLIRDNKDYWTTRVSNHPIKNLPNLETENSGISNLTLAELFKIYQNSYNYTIIEFLFPQKHQKYKSLANEYKKAPDANNIFLRSIHSELFNLNETINYFSIAEPNYFDNYFNYKISDSNLQLTEINELEKNINNIEKFNYILLELCKNGKFNEYKRYLESGDSKITNDKDNILMLMKNTLLTDSNELYDYIYDKEILGYAYFIFEDIRRKNNEHSDRKQISQDEIYELLIANKDILKSYPVNFIKVVIYQYIQLKERELSNDIKAKKDNLIQLVKNDANLEQIIKRQDFALLSILNEHFNLTDKIKDILQNLFPSDVTLISNFSDSLAEIDNYFYGFNDPILIKLLKDTNLFDNLEETMITKYLNNKYESDLIQNKTEAILKWIIRKNMGAAMNALLLTFRDQEWNTVSDLTKNLNHFEQLFLIYLIKKEDSQCNFDINNPLKKVADEYEKSFK